jgi:hypothetical protein
MTKSSQSQSSASQKQSKGSRSTAGGSSSGKLDNVLYNVITVLHEKSKGLEAYEQYEQDLQGQPEIKDIFDEIRSNDEQAVTQLRDCLRLLVSPEGERGQTEEEEAA